MNETERESLAALLDYNWNDEERDYHENGRDPNHVFVHLMRLKSYLDVTK